MRTILDIVRACQSAQVFHVYLRYVEELVTEVRPPLSGYVKRRAREAAADDILQEVLVAITRGVRGFKGNTVGSVWSWCYQIARNKLADGARNEARNATDHYQVEEISRAIQAAESSRALNPRELLEMKETLAMLGRLNPKDQELLWQHYGMQQRFVDIADDMGMKADAVRMAVKRARIQAEKLLIKQEA
jgi:RNA polymerase sigma factor (sigma-70 family)